MFRLTDDFKDSFEWDGNTFNVDMSFNNILLLFEMFKDDLILKHEKPLYAIDMLVVEDIEYLINTYDEAKTLYYFLMKEFLDIDLELLETNNSSNEQDNKPIIFDYEKDAGLIYASFLSCYGMDLFEQKDKLHWNKFIMLVNHLDDKSKLKQVIGYRDMKIPTLKQASQEQINHIRKMKRIYSLEDKEEVVSNRKSIDDALDVVSAALKNRANKKK